MAEVLAGIRANRMSGAHTSAEVERWPQKAQDLSGHV